MEKTNHRDRNDGSGFVPVISAPPWKCTSTGTDCGESRGMDLGTSTEAERDVLSMVM